MTKIADDSKTPLVSSTATNDRVTRNHPYVSRVCFGQLPGWSGPIWPPAI
jgi:hypothetical protein